MKENKLQTISNLFEDNEIRSIWDSEKEDYFFSVVDVIGALTDLIIWIVQNFTEIRSSSKRFLLLLGIGSQRHT